MTSPPCSIILSYSIFFSASVVFPNLFLIFVNKSSAVLISDSLLASSSNKLSFYASAIPFCMYDNTHAIWVVPSSSVIFILKYKWATLINMLTFSIFSLNTWGLMTSTAQPAKEDWVFYEPTIAVEETLMENQQDFFPFLLIFYWDPKGHNHKYYPLVSFDQLGSSLYDVVCAWHHHIVQPWIDPREHKA